MAEHGNQGRNPFSKPQPTSLLLNPPASGFVTNYNQIPLLVPFAPPQTNTSVSDISSDEPQLYTSDQSIQLPQVENVEPQQPTFPDNLSDPTKTSGRFSQFVFTPIHPHWMYCQQVEKKPVWVPFSLLDSMHLEEVFTAKSGSEDFANVVVQTDGGRYDVYLKEQERHAVYWEENNTPVRRATWFYKPYGARLFIPYPEKFADKLEEEYCVAVSTNTWHRRLEFPEGDTVVIHNPNVIVHYQASSPHEWEGVPEDQVKPTVVKRGLDDFESIEDGEGLQIDHLVFVVHGIGAMCDLRFRTLPECVNDFRTISAGLLKSHFRQHVDEGHLGRIEFLPASWHTFLHGEATGIDDKLKPITLTSIPKLRYFTNDAILDVLFYTSPVYCQAIINQVCSEINRLYALFLSRNPSFQGKVSLAGHSLGSVILFDLLLHQNSSTPESPLRETIEVASFDQNESLSDILEQLGMESFIETFEREKIDVESMGMCSENDFKEMGIPLGQRKKLLAYLKEKQDKVLMTETDKLKDSSRLHEHDSSLELSRRQSETTINYVVGLAGTGHPFIIYPRLDFEPTCFFALGSPIAMFLTVRGLDTQWDDFKLPTCPAFYNIFHPYDPVAYRIEPLINPENYNLKPVMISHHKGRKRMHLEIKESLSRMSVDLKQKFVDSLRSTWNTINDFARSHTQIPQSEEQAEVDRMVEEELIRHDNELSQSAALANEMKVDEPIGQLNGGRRLDYVLQEKPLESFNEYLFALGSHTCYWESEDTVLLMLKEVYGSYGFYPSDIPIEQTSAPKPPVLYNIQEAQRYYASNPVPPPNQSLSGPSAFNQYRNTSSQYRSYPNQPPTSPYSTGLGESVSGDGYSTVNPNPVLNVSSTPGPPPLSGFVRQSAIRK